ncbi:MAG: hypothetical protein L0027_11770 [Candidatus Rokubacteria bacterium]|nr:hypothetical protein [Candidatus Rokubacteria bacterium]
MTALHAWGIFREEAHSPGREGDDAEILRRTAKCLEAKGFHVELRGPDDLGPGDARPDGAFLMCERLEVLRALFDWEAQGVRQVNSPRAVLNTYRERMVTALEATGAPFIESRLVDTDAPVPAAALPVWVKRGDVHNTQDGDVVLAPTAEAVRLALAGLAARGIPRAVIQPHLEGDLVKFYGVGRGGGGEHGGPPWFRWFYHKDQRLAGYPFDAGRLARAVRQAATALGLEVYGGDAIVTPSGDIVLLDVNAWPSFALYRDEAAEVIAAYLARRFESGR